MGAGSEKLRFFTSLTKAKSGSSVVNSMFLLIYDFCKPGAHNCSIWLENEALVGPKMLQMVFEEHRKVFAKMVTKFGPGLDSKRCLFGVPKKSLF